MKLTALGLASLLLLTSCSNDSDFACRSLQFEWDQTMTGLSQLPSAFEDMTKEQGKKWAELTDEKNAIADKIFELENCDFY